MSTLSSSVRTLAVVLALLVVVACASQRSTTAASAPAPPPPRVESVALPLKHTATPTTGAITPADLLSRLYVYADDSMQGRAAGTPGNVKATEYIAAEVKRLGLEPAGDDGTFFQRVPIGEQVLDSLSTVAVGGARLTVWKDYAPLPVVSVFPFGRSVAVKNAQTIYGGRLGDTTAMIAPALAAGKIVVLSAPQADSAKGPPFVFWTRAGLNRYPKAAGVAIATLDVSPPGLVEAVLDQTRFSLGDDDEREATTRPFGFLVTTSTATRLLGAQLASLRPGAVGQPVTASVRFVRRPATLAPARNVVAILRGSDPTLRTEFVAIGAHNDHIGLAPKPADHDSIRAFNAVFRQQGAETPPSRPDSATIVRYRALLDSLRTAHPARADSVFNGADDDGSGTVSVLEIAEAFVRQEPRPKRSILFVWHTGEEKGLWGSQWFTDHPTVPRDSIVAQLNIDMIGRGDSADVTGATKEGQLLHGGPNYVQLVGSRRLSTELGDLAERVNADGKHGLAFDYSLDANGHPQNIYCRSDHYEYARYGIPIIFFTTGGHRDYHQLTDEPQYIDYPHMARVAGFVQDLATRVANLDHRVVVDKPKPDPKGDCKQ